MNKMMLLFGVIAIIAIGGVGYFFLSSDSDDDKKDNDTEIKEEDKDSSDDSEMENVDAEEEEDIPDGPVPFSEVGVGIMDADMYSYFAFEDGAGTCMDQGFPTDLVYDTKNMIKTQSGSYQDDWTTVDFMGYVGFKSLPLTSGSASCTMETSSKSDTSSVTCKVDNVEVCTATFNVFGYK